MHLTRPLCQPQLWQKTLPTLKSAHLKSIAQATGIKFAGTKATVLERIQGELSRHEAGKKQKSENDQNQDKGLSVLSIDMGIRNLAFAHLTVSPSSSPTSKSAKKSEVTLNAWHRIDISANQLSTSTSTSTSPGPIDTSIPKSERRVQEKEQEKEAHTMNEIYTPDFYAQNAYAFLITLMEKYQPTHILIERQRFRSASGVAVQEWSLRVGVFEGMLYAVLYTLARQRRLSLSSHEPAPFSGFFGSGNLVDFGPGPVVHGIEPSRVLRYWGERMGFKNVFLEGKEKKTAKDGKKVKIDLAGHWLDPEHPITGKVDEDGGLSTDLIVGDDVGLNETLHAYLAKWHKKRGKEKGKDIGKLDDLADCLVQGMTWLEWQVMRDRILREGVDFFLENGN
ncbi:uncharacterized protein ACHE_20631S [Aspergillus chevalieri]|uniref:Mitochondrial resolvase Ydc2 catalytic domain-containing protein n=1 Tax=Aspergillus chevalieri TaxID=182096 RepID=A0A7R7ZK87_ASPCH|nr:uncharacterized protein ACHE_20631S [Aspergillus chevalieri]BCR85173.1 hypothetical protein ACHE_20631S [Aspergillus chevalieri]